MTTIDSGILLPSGRTDEQRMIAAEVERIATAAGAADRPHRAAWDALAETGLHAVLLEEELAAGSAELVLIAEGLGRALCADAFVWGGVAVPTLLAALPSAEAAALARRIAGGELATIAMHGPEADVETIGSTLVVVETDAGATVSGRAWFVPFGEDADAVVVLARRGEELVVALVDEGQEGVAWEALAPFDLGSSPAHVRFESASATILGAVPAQPAELLAPTLLCQGAAVVGSATQALLDATGYSRIRVQFGVPIGDFQAIRHRLAEMLVEVELMRSAIAAADGGAHGVLTAAYHCLAAAPAIMRGNIQIHGGIGYTWEHSAHRHFRYAYSSRQAVCSFESLERVLMAALTGQGR